MATHEREDRPGVAVDATGGPTFDPSSNVLDLVQAAIKRVDDLREADIRFHSMQIAHAETVSAMRETHERYSRERDDENEAILHNVQFQHVEQVAEIRATHTKELFTAEAGRIDANREGDINAVSTAAARQDQQAVVLANQVAASAETLRALVASTNAAVANNLSQISTQLMERIASVDKTNSDRIAMLEKTSYMGKGREEVSDPLLARLYAEMKAMNDSQGITSGKGVGMTHLWGIIVAAIAAVGVIVMMFDKLAR